MRGASIVRRVWGRKFPRGSRGEAAVEVEDEVPEKLKQFADIVYRF